MFFDRHNYYTISPLKKQGTLLKCRGFLRITGGRECRAFVPEENLFRGKVLLRLLSKPLWTAEAGLYG